MEEERIIRAKVQSERDIPVITESTHPGSRPGMKLYYDSLYQLGDGYTVIIEPPDINRSNCRHPDGFKFAENMAVSCGIPGQDTTIYRPYQCPICHTTRGIEVNTRFTDGTMAKADDELPPVIDHLPTNHNWDYYTGSIAPIPKEGNRE